jgi:hypothetical protein
MGLRDFLDFIQSPLVELPPYSRASLTQGSPFGKKPVHIAKLFLVLKNQSICQ